MPSRSPLVAACCLIGAALLFMSLLGCSPAPPGVVPVAGEVLLDGQPLVEAVVTFQPLREGSAVADAVGGSVGKTDSQGRFRLRLIKPDAPGAAIGKHVVTITTAIADQGDARPPRGERVPLAWRNGSQTFDVPEEGNLEVRLELQTKPRR